MNSDGSRFSMAWGRFFFVTVWLLYSATAFALGRLNALGQRHRQLDLLFMALPILAFVGYWVALFGSPYLRPRSWFTHCGLVVLSFAALFFSTLFWLLFLVNIYGS
ncbi:MAG: hypothetical protein M3Z22_06710 [Verrucomicrobiota bacterium]|nr:hypothetical protein [Verrucomicrobiota bacterium]